MNYVYVYGQQPVPYWNVGDYIQSIAALQFLDDAQYVDRDVMDITEGNIIMNGWHWHKSPQLSMSINPLITSFHINSTSLKMLDEHVDFFKKHEPIGCRDAFTVRQMRNRGIEAFFIGCLTMTLGLSWKHNPQKGLFVCNDINHLHGWKDAEKYFDQLVNPLRITSNMLGMDHPERFETAKHFLDILSRAECVVTSRLHTLLPCLAMGTPVVFVDQFENRESDQCRLEGLIDHGVIARHPDELEYKIEEAKEHKVNFSDNIELFCSEIRKTFK